MRAHREEGDAIEGDLIVGEARKIGKPRVVIGTARHRTQQIVLQENAFCIIKKKLRFLPK